MALRNYTSERAQNLIEISSTGSGLWKDSKIFPGLRYLRLRNDIDEKITEAEEKKKLPTSVDDIDDIYLGHLLMSKGKIDPSLGNHGATDYIFVKSDNRTYTVGDMTLYGGQWYVCIKNATNQEITATEYFIPCNLILPLNIGDDDLQFKSSFAYKVGDIFIHDETVYAVKTAHTSDDKVNTSNTLVVTFDAAKIYGLEAHSWGTFISEGNLVGLVWGSTSNMWIKGSDSSSNIDTFYYNNSDLGSKYKLKNKPSSVYLKYRLLKEAASKLPKDLLENEWKWDLDPSQSYYTIWIGYKTSDPDQESDTKFIAVNENIQTQTIYTSVNNPNSHDIYKPGQPVVLVPRVANGKSVIILAITAFNRSHEYGAELTLTLNKSNGKGFVVWKGKVNPNEGIEITTPHVLNAGDSLGVNSNNKDVSVLISVNEE